jgi:hypothetical protein
MKGERVTPSGGVFPSKTPSQLLFSDSKALPGGKGVPSV